MTCTHPLQLKGVTVRCGNCLACRVTKTFEWKVRLLHELQNFDSAMFVTLTFDNEHVGDNCLSKKEFSDFHKRVRKHICLECEHYQQAEADSKYRANHCGKFCTKRIKYYGCGEYSPTGQKHKHYHDIIFGLSAYDDDDRQIIVDSWKNCAEWQFDKSRGRKSAIGSVTPDSIQYVTGYIRKKLGGELAKKEYGEKQPPFSMCSQGLGKSWLESHSDKLIRDQFLNVSGKRVGLPRYYRDKLGLTALSGNLKQISADVNSQEFLADCAETQKAFEAYYYDKFGFNDCQTLSKLDHMSREFVKWYDDLMSAYTKQVFEDFYVREKIKR